MTRFSLVFFLQAALVWQAWGADRTAVVRPPIREYLPEERCPEELRPLFDHFDKALEELAAEVKAKHDPAVTAEFERVLEAQLKELLECKQQILAAKRVGGEAGKALVDQFLAITGEQAAGRISDEQGKLLRAEAWAKFLGCTGLVKLIITTDPPRARIRWRPRGETDWRGCWEGFLWVASGQYEVKASRFGVDEAKEVAVAGAETAVVLSVPMPKPTFTVKTVDARR